MKIAQKALKLLEPEKAHKLVLKALEKGYVPSPVTSCPHQSCNLFGRPMPNRFGIPAGFIKGEGEPAEVARAILSIFAMGWGFLEIGSVPPVARPGNPAPRHWRFGEGAINWYGLNSPGFQHILTVLRLVREQNPGAVIGLSLVIPASADYVPDVADLTRMAREAQLYVDFFTINRGCPNTGEAVDKTEETLKSELGAVLLGAGDKPAYVKYAPFIGSAQHEKLATLVQTADDLGAGGHIVCNTLTHAQCREFNLLPPEELARWPQRPDPANGGKVGPVGGLSGPLLYKVMKDMFHVVNDVTWNNIICVGGIDSPQKANELLNAGASAIQTLTGLAGNERLLEDLVHNT